MNRKVIISFVVLLAGMLACAVPAGIMPTPVVITQIVVVTNEPEQIQASATPLIPTDPPATVPPAFTATPISASTSANTAALAVVATTTPNGPIATFVQNANCRKGPGTTYEVVTSFLEGDTVRIVGRNPNFNNTWWYVEIPSGGNCWVSLTTAQAYGNFTDIPTVTP